MKHFTERAYTDTGDLQTMIDLTKARPRERITDFPSMADLPEMLSVAEIQANTHLWYDQAGQLAGFAILDGASLFFDVAPMADDEALAARMIAWAAESLRRGKGSPGAPFGLETNCRDDDHQRIALLGQHGFIWDSVGAIYMYRQLDEPIPEPVPPQGFTIRTSAGEAEAEAWVVLHRAAWGTQKMTLEYRIAMLRAPTYDPALDLVVVAPDGTLAAYCECLISAQENALTGRKDGYTDPIATHPTFQRRGLARALLLTGLRLLKARGLDTALLGTSQENIAMQELARSVGFRTYFTKSWYVKHLYTKDN